MISAHFFVDCPMDDATLQFVTSISSSFSSSFSSSEGWIRYPKLSSLARLATSGQSINQSVLYLCAGSPAAAAAAGQLLMTQLSGSYVDLIQPDAAAVSMAAAVSVNGQNVATYARNCSVGSSSSCQLREVVNLKVMEQNRFLKRLLLIEKTIN